MDKEITKDLFRWIRELRENGDAANMMRMYEKGYITLWELLTTLHDIEVEQKRKENGYDTVHSNGFSD